MFVSTENMKNNLILLCYSCGTLSIYFQNEAKQLKEQGDFKLKCLEIGLIQSQIQLSKFKIFSLCSSCYFFHQVCYEGIFIARFLLKVTVYLIRQTVLLQVNYVLIFIPLEKATSNFSWKHQSIKHCTSHMHVTK